MRVINTCPLCGENLGDSKKTDSLKLNRAHYKAKHEDLYNRESVLRYSVAKAKDDYLAFCRSVGIKPLGL